MLLPNGRYQGADAGHPPRQVTEAKKTSDRVASLQGPAGPSQEQLRDQPQGQPSSRSGWHQDPQQLRRCTGKRDIASHKLAQGRDRGRGWRLERNGVGLTVDESEKLDSG